METVCAAHGRIEESFTKNSDILNKLDLKVALLSSKMDLFSERMDRHGTAVQTLAESYEVKLLEHDRQLQRVMVEQINSREKIQDLSKSGSDWKDWGFRLLITAMVGWLIASQQHVQETKQAKGGYKYQSEGYAP